MADLRGYVEGMIGFEGGGTTVVANPTGTPTDDLESIQIDETIYSVGGGENIVPTPTNIDRGKYLGVKSNANELEYREVREVPSGEGANAGDVLTHTISGESWLPPAKELPTYTSADNDKVLGVSDGALAWLTQGGGGGSYSATPIFSQDVSTTGNITLTDSIDNYKFILVATNQQGIYASFNLFPVDLFKAWCNAMSNGMMCFEYPSRYLVLDYVDNTTLRVAEISSTVLSAIYGINI